MSVFSQSFKQISNFFRSPFRLIILGFLVVILLGSCLLMLPFASQAGQWTGFLPALFTATSATCVTGLVVVDTATYWSTFGQIVILILIQIGGLGVVTMTGAFALLSMRKIGLFERNTMQEAMSAPQMGGIVRLLIFILQFACTIELLGTLLLLPRFVADFGWLKGLWYAVFHAVSAFCNAGFDLFGFQARFSSLTNYAADASVILPLSLLVIIGGLGFLTWDDVRSKKWYLHKYKMQSKVIILVTLILLLVPFVYFFCSEFSSASFVKRLLLSWFQAVSPRTAGFNSADLTKLSESGQGLITILMLIGAAPGSTAGGIKVTTIAVLFAALISVWRRQGDINFFKRRIDNNLITQAATILLLYLTLLLLSALSISRIEQLPLHAAIFECTSAIATVGLSLGLTPNLSTLSRLILIVLMFLGRVGGLTIIYATFVRKNVVNSHLPQEHMTVG